MVPSQIGQPLCSSAITAPSSLLQVAPSLYSTLVLSHLGCSPLCFSLSIGVTGSHVPHKSPDRTLATSMPDADRAVNRHLPDLSCGNETSAVLTSSPRFDTSSVVHLRSTLRPIPDQIEFGLFLSRSPQRLLNDAAVGGLKPPPVRRLRGTYPHLLCSIAARRNFTPCAPSWHTLIGMQGIALQ